MKTKKKVIVFGSSIIAKLAYNCFSETSDYEVVGFCVSSVFLTKESFCGLPLVSFEDIQVTFPPDEYLMFIAVGSKNLNTLREKIFESAKLKGYKFANCISKHALVCNDVEIGENCLIMPGVVLEPFSVIYDNVILWGKTHIGHNTHVKNNCFMVGAGISGYCSIERNCFIGVGSFLSEGIVVSEYNYISMGSILNKSTSPNSVYRGNPAKKMDINSLDFYESL